MGTTEAVHSGVPMVGIPLFGDQEVNVRSYVSEGFALKLHFNSITKESVLQALRTVLHDTRWDPDFTSTLRLVKGDLSFVEVICRLR